VCKGEGKINMTDATNSAAKESHTPPKQADPGRLFQDAPQRTTTGQLLLEVALFAAENNALAENPERAAVLRAREHLVRVRALAEKRLVELAELVETNS
jgi:hypothetical protein